MNIAVTSLNICLRTVQHCTVIIIMLLNANLASSLKTQ